MRAGDRAVLARNAIAFADLLAAGGQLSVAAAVDEEALAELSALAAADVFVHRATLLAQAYELQAATADALHALDIATKIGDDQRTAAALACMADILRRRGDYGAAIASADDALALLGDSPAERARALVVRARIDFDRAEYAAAARLLDQATTLTPGDAMTAVLAGRVARSRGELDRSQELLAAGLEQLEGGCGADAEPEAEALAALGDIAVARGEYGGAEQLFGGAFSVAEANHAECLPVAANILVKWSEAAIWLRPHGDAEPMVRRALRIVEGELGADHPQRAAILRQLAYLRRLKGDYPSAEALLAEAARIDAKRSAVAPMFGLYSRAALATLRHAQARYTESVPMYESLLQEAKERLGPGHPDVASYEAYLAEGLRGRSDLAEARRHAEESLRIRRARFHEADPAVIDGLRVLARIEREQGDLVSATQHGEEALAADWKRLGSSDTVATDLEWLSFAMQRRGDLEQWQILQEEMLQVRLREEGWSAEVASACLRSVADAVVADRPAQTPEAARRRREDARELLQAALAISVSCGGWRSPATADTLWRLSSLELAEGDPVCAENHAREAVSIYEEGSAIAQPFEFLRAKTVLKNVYTREKAWDRAIAEAEDMASFSAALFGPSASATGVYLHDLALAYWNAGQLEAARPRYETAAQLFRENGNFTDEVNTLYQLAQVERTLQKAHAAAEHLQRAVAVGERAYGTPSHPALYDVYGALAASYEDEDQQASALPLRRMQVEINERIGYGAAASNTGPLYRLGRDEAVLRRYKEARQHLERALAIDRRGADPAEIVPDLEQLANFYVTSGNYKEAKAAAIEAITLTTSSGQQGSSARLCRLYNSLSGAYISLNEPENASIAARKALNLATAAGDRVLVSEAKTQLANALCDLDQNEEAERIYREILQEDEQGMADPDSDAYATDLMNLALLLQTAGRLQEAAPYFEKAVAIDLAALDPADAELETMLSNVASFYVARGDQACAREMFMRMMDNIRENVQPHLAYMTEDERLALQDAHADNLKAFYSFCEQFGQTDPDLRADMFETALWHKGIVARSIAAAQQAVKTTGSVARLALQDRLRIDATRLTRALDPASALPMTDVSELRDTIRQEEEQLFRDLAIATPPRISCPDVLRALRSDEAAVEFLRFPHHDGTVWKEGMYVALILSAAIGDRPLLVHIGSTRDVEGRWMADYRALTTGQPGAGRLFAASVWEPVRSRLTGVHRIYISPEAQLHGVSWQILPSGGGAVIDDYDVRIVNSTAELVEPPRTIPSHSAVIFGNVDFGSVPRRLRKKTASPLLDPLPGTRVEVGEVAQLLRGRNWSVETYEGKAATAEALRSVRSPRVLHVATHSFISQRGEERTPESMIRNGIYLAGVNRRNLDGDSHQGIFTAAEGRYLDLFNTELVVLSACNTGGGDVKIGEGVFGLPRALIEAGAQSVMVSLWAVPDREAQWLIAEFYRNWRDGVDKHDALRQAMLAAKQRHVSSWMRRAQGDRAPHWGSFVIVGR
jgi:tetratricopeptide (TPR) repeat protein